MPYHKLNARRIIKKVHLLIAACSISDVLQLLTSTYQLNGHAYHLLALSREAKA